MIAFVLRCYSKVSAGTYIRYWMSAAALLCGLFVPTDTIPQTSNPPNAATASPIDQYKSRGYVNDFAGIVAPEFKPQLEAISKDLDQKSEIQLAFVTVESLQGLTVKDFATQLANRWGVGHKDTNRGILILLAVSERQYRIAIGKGLESVFTDQEADRLGREIIPLLRERNFGAALLQVAKSIQVELPPKLQTSEGTQTPVW